MSLCLSSAGAAGKLSGVGMGRGGAGTRAAKMPSCGSAARSRMGGQRCAAARCRCAARGSPSLHRASQRCTAHCSAQQKGRDGERACSPVLSATGFGCAAWNPALVPLTRAHGKGRDLVLLRLPGHPKVLRLHHQVHLPVPQQLRQLGIVRLHSVLQQAQHAPLLVLLVGRRNLRTGNPSVGPTAKRDLQTLTGPGAE